jgi:hypothetical protein
MSTLFFIHVDFSKPFILATNTSNFALSVAFSQLADYKLFHLIDFRLHTLLQKWGAVH